MPTTERPTTDRANTHAVFKAYDVRGTVPDQLDEELCRRTGEAFVRLTGAPTIVVGYDMRPSSPALAAAFAAGAADSGADVLMIGLASTDQLYFASGELGHPGAMFTASHNPASYNGIKLCRAGAQPVGAETGLREIRDAVSRPEPAAASTPGTISQRDVLEAYAAHLLALAPVPGRRLKVVVDAGNGMAGLTAPVVFERIGHGVELVPLYFELDGTFPNHEANPIEPANLVDLQAKVRETGADIGLAFDGDADRCFLVIKAEMAETGAIFGGEHSGHFYFRDFWRADSGMLAALHALAALAEGEAPLAELLAPYARHVASGEINSEVADQQAVIEELEQSWTGRAGISVDHLDGLTVTHDDWWFNVRASNTEPLLRLNAEGRDAATMARVRGEAAAMVRTSDR